MPEGIRLGGQNINRSVEIDVRQAEMHRASGQIGVENRFHAICGSDLLVGVLHITAEIETADGGTVGLQARKAFGGFVDNFVGFFAFAHGLHLLQSLFNDGVVGIDVQRQREIHSGGVQISLQRETLAAFDIFADQSRAQSNSLVYDGYIERSVARSFVIILQSLWKCTNGLLFFAPLHEGTCAFWVKRGKSDLFGLTWRRLALLLLRRSERT